jgi:hypothetical protein
VLDLTSSGRMIPSDSNPGWVGAVIPRGFLLVPASRIPRSPQATGRLHRLTPPTARRPEYFWLRLHPRARRDASSGCTGKPLGSHGISGPHAHTPSSVATSTLPEPSLPASRCSEMQTSTPPRTDPNPWPGWPGSTPTWPTRRLQVLVRLGRVSDGSSTAGHGAYREFLQHDHRVFVRQPPSGLDAEVMAAAPLASP